MPDKGKPPHNPLLPLPPLADPIKVPAEVILHPEQPKAEPAKVGDPYVAPTTTAEFDRKTSGQRRINLIWEVVQAAIAMSVVMTVLWVASSLAFIAVNPEVTERQAAIANPAFMLLSNLVSLVIGFYFGRTNHTRQGGIGGHQEGEGR